MPLIAAVATLSPDAALARDALHALANDPAFTLGERHGAVQALVFETTQRRADRSMDRALQALPGVLHVDVISAIYDELLEEAP